MTVLKRFAAAALLLTVMHTCAAAQTMRFETNVGSFDMVLNPTNDPNLRPLVDNLVAYIGLGRYHHTAINRAADGDAGTADDFVLQMGGFLGFPTAADLWAPLHTAVETFDGVVVDEDGDGEVDFSTLSNTRGTVSMALQANNPNSGTSSFFINLGSNTFLDESGFVPFARVDDMTTIDRILQLTQEDLSDEAGQPGSLAFTDVPLVENNRIVVLKSVRVVSSDPNFSFVGPIASKLQLEARNASSAAAALAAEIAADSEDESLAALTMESGLDAAATGAAAPPAAANVPEPAAATLAALGVLAAARFLRRRRA